MSTLEKLFPSKDLKALKTKAAEINLQRSFDRISVEEQEILLDSLLDSVKIITAQNKLERQKLTDQAITLLKLIPIKV